MQYNFAAWLDLLERALQEELPGTEAQLEMAPRYRMALKDVRIDDKECYKASVLISVFPDEKTGRASFVLTKRRDDLANHAGQIALPGGQVDEGESLQEAALREAEEETALRSTDVEIVAPLTPLYIPPSEFCVYPFIGLVRRQPEFSALATEVERLFQVPIHELTDEKSKRRERRMLHGSEVTVPFFLLSGEKVWGATAMILSEFRRICQNVAHQSP